MDIYFNPRNTEKMKIVQMFKLVKLAELICRIQEKEGNSPCFRKREVCSELSCCWQASCDVIMEGK